MIDYNSVFIDTSPFIYFLERSRNYYSTLKSFFTTALIKQKALFTSVITVEEYCVYPIKRNEIKYITNFNTFLNDLNIQINPIQYDTVYKAAELRALYPGIKSMDALQLASSFITNCDIFLTNDTQLVQVKEVNVILLSDLDIA